MMNSDFVTEHARLLTDRLVNEASLKDTESLIKNGFEMVLGRLPEPSEMKLCQELIESMQQEFGHDRKTAIERFALMMLNLNEFIYLD